MAAAINNKEVFGVLVEKSKVTYKESDKTGITDPKIVIQLAPSSGLEFTGISVWGAYKCSIVKQLQIGSVIGFSNLKDVDPIYHKKMQLSTIGRSRILHGPDFESQEKVAKLRMEMLAVAGNASWNPILLE